IVKAKHKRAAFTGEGSQFASGRWHNLKEPLVYCSDSHALAALELFVHLQEDGKQIKFLTFEARIPPELVLDVESIATLPKGWRKQPPGAATKKIGSDWVASAVSAVLSAPSAIVTSGRNYLLNPQHPDFHKIVINKPVPFSFDSRLWK
ncbi:MAG: hypothetical protein FD130_369, partial [Halothiobacillaceae bacterium]